jgi:hypothetical protein
VCQLAVQKQKSPSNVIDTSRGARRGGGGGGMAAQGDL